MSTPSVFGLPDFMLEGDYLGMQTPQIVGMKNPTTAFRENKQLKRHETPFDTRSVACSAIAILCFSAFIAPSSWHAERLTATYSSVRQLRQ